MAQAPTPCRALLFALEGRNYAIRVAAVGGVAESGPIRKLPGAPSAVVGLAEWRGNVLTVLDLPHLLGHAPGDAAPCLIRLAPPLHQAALLLTAYLSVADVDSDSEPFEVDGPDGGTHGFMARVEHEGSVVRLIDPVRLFRHVDSEARGLP
jgi:hypothetical protein